MRRVVSWFLEKAPSVRVRARRWRRWLVGVVALCCATLAVPLPESAAPGGTAVSLRLTDRTGVVLREVRPDGRRRPVTLDAIDPAVIDALLAIEDRRFWWHPGIDPIAIGRAALSNLTQGRIVSGGSTLTMQVARLLRGVSNRGLGDKLAELHLALRLELRWSKEQILAAWLNRVPFGNRARGIEAAARLYFGTSARGLERAEAAYLVGLPQSPSRYNPFRHPERATARQQRVLDAMLRAGVLSEAERTQLAAFPLDIQPPETVFRAPHFTQWLLESATVRERRADPLTEVRTTLDARLQRIVEGLVRTHIDGLGNESVTNAAAVVLDNRSGAIRAYVGSADFWNAAIAGQNDGVQMLRQPGSTLKPFAYGRALASRRVTAASVLADIPLEVPEGGGAFRPTNYDERYHGPTPLRTALACSYNVPAVRLARQMGPAALLETLHDAGFASLTRPASHYGVGLTLGNGEVRLLELARAYAGLARGGSLPPVRPIASARTARGDTLRPETAPARPMGRLTAPVASLLTDMLSDPDARAPAFGRGGPLECPFPCAVKTGTSKDYRDNWTVGYTPRHTVAVWVGNFDGSPMRRVSGVTGAGPLFQSILRAVGPGGAFAPSSDLETATVCPASGRRPNAHCPNPRPERVLPGTAPSDTCAVHRRVAIDRRTGQRADAQTPVSAVDERLFAVHPPRYHDWMRRHNVPLPPPASATQTPARTTAEPQRAPRQRLQIQRPRITYPTAGLQFMMDPVLRADHQQIRPRATVPPEWRDAHWTVNGTRLAGPWAEARWRLAPGRHTLRLHAAPPRGPSIPVDSVRIRVLGRDLQNE